MSKTEILLKELNALRGVEYPDVGYSYFADIKGDGNSNRKVYTVMNVDGGVVYSGLNGKSSQETCKKIREFIKQERKKLRDAK